VELAQPVQHLLQRLVVGVVEVELHPHVGQAEQAGGAHRGEVGNARHRHLDRDGDVALDLLRALARVLGEDDDLRRHRVRVGLDVQPREAPQAEAHEREVKEDDQRLALEREGDDLPHGGGALCPLPAAPAVSLCAPRGR
jgi:hypothetical protein